MFAIHGIEARICLATCQDCMRALAHTDKLRNKGSKRRECVMEYGRELLGVVEPTLPRASTDSVTGGLTASE